MQGEECSPGEGAVAHSTGQVLRKYDRMALSIRGQARRHWDGGVQSLDPRVAHLQLSLQTGLRAQHRGHHVLSDGEVLWEVATAADQDRVVAIQELGGEEGVLLPVFNHVLWGGAAGEKAARSSQHGPPPPPPELHCGVAGSWGHPGLPSLLPLYLSLPGLQPLPLTQQQI